MIGKQIGRYRLTEEIGRGGMGIVYKATQITLNRTVAVKMLPEDLASSAEYLARFTREAETLATLQHPNIVHIYDVEKAHGCHFIIMEYVGGPPLTRRLQLQGRLAPDEVQSLSISLAGALEAAHRRGIIHRDIKPDNILFSEDGTPKLTDFGIARMRDSNVKTQTGVMMGTPYYMSPEQVGGTPIRAASDVYSLGVVMYEMLSGRVPFRADTPVAVALKHLHERAIPLEQVAPGVPAELCAVVERAMEKDPNDRFQSAQALRRTLRSLNLPATPEMGTSCPRCGMGLLPDFCACPGCGMAVDSPRTMGPIAPRARQGGPPQPVRAGGEAADAARGAAGAARGAAGAARGAADAGLDRLAAAREAVVESAGAALAAVGRSAEAVWSAVGPRREGEPEGPAGASDSASRSAADSSSEPRLALPSLAGLGALARVRELPRLPLVAWVGVALIIGGILVATLLADSGGTQIAIDPDPSSQGAQGSPQDMLIRPPSSRVVGVIDPAREGDEGNGTGDDGTGDEGTDDGTRETDPGGGTPRNGEEDPGEEADPGDDPSTPGDEGHDEPEEEEEEEDHTTPVSPEPDDPDPSDDAANREAETRMAVDGIVARQRRATETNDLDLFVFDLHPDATSHDGKTNRDAARRALRDLHRRNEDIESTISNVRIELHDSTRATVRYHSVIRATPRGDDGPRTLAEGEFRWELEYQGGRWLIVRF